MMGKPATDNAYFKGLLYDLADLGWGNGDMRLSVHDGGTAEILYFGRVGIDKVRSVLEKYGMELKQRYEDVSMYEGQVQTLGAEVYSNGTVTAEVQFGSADVKKEGIIVTAVYIYPEEDKK